jgi:hypothetical protein
MRLNGRAFFTHAQNIGPKPHRMPAIMHEQDHAMWLSGSSEATATSRSDSARNTSIISRRPVLAFARSFRPGVGPMLRQLSPKPAMDRCQQVNIGSLKCDRSAGGELCVRDFDAGGSGLNFFKARHAFTMRRRGIGVVTRLRHIRQVPEMLANQRDLIGVGWIFRYDRLDSSGLGHPEDVNGLCHVKRHFGVCHFVDVRLRRFGEYRGTTDEQQDGDRRRYKG